MRAESKEEVERYCCHLLPGNHLWRSLKLKISAFSSPCNPFLPHILQGLLMIVATDFQHGNDTFPA